MNTFAAAVGALLVATGIGIGGVGGAVLGVVGLALFGAGVYRTQAPEQPDFATFQRVDPNAEGVWKLYAIASMDNGVVREYKFGITEGPVPERVDDLDGTSSPYPLVTMAVVPGDRTLETAVHNVLARYRTRTDRKREWFRPAEDVIDLVRLMQEVGYVPRAWLVMAARQAVVTPKTRANQ